MSVRGLRLVFLAAVLATLSFVGVAYADHYHTVNYRAHGIVQGDYPRDGSFFGRTEIINGDSYAYCAIGDVDRGYYFQAYSYGTQLCSVWAANYFQPDECLGVSGNAVSAPNGIGGHNHYRHGYDGTSTSCRITRS